MRKVKDNKIVKIDLSDDRLIGLAADLVDEHEYITALKMLNKNAELTGNDEDSYMLYAEIFDDLGLYEKSINSWYKFLDVAHFNELSEAYEGLAVGYMNLGNNGASAYYYNKLLTESDDVDEETRKQIITDFLSDEENPLKFVYPPQLADVSEILSEGVRLMKGGKYEEAEEKFSLVAEGNPKWVTARNYTAMCLIVRDKTAEAEAVCRETLKKYPQDIQALTTLAAVLTESGKKDEAREVTRSLIALDPENSDEIYKIATVCCENKCHAEALDLFSKLDADYEFDLNVMFFSAISAFNCGKYERSFKLFDKLLTIYPDAETARFWYMTAREMHERGEEEELDYFYRLPQVLRQSSLTTLAALARLSSKDLEMLSEKVNISSLVKWCFDECEPTAAEELISVASVIAVRSRFDDFVRDLLLNAFLPEGCKKHIIYALCERNEDNDFGLVLDDVLTRIYPRKLILGRTKKKAFVGTYAALFVEWGLKDEQIAEDVADTVERVYDEMSEKGTLDRASDTAALAAAVFSKTKHAAGLSSDGICAHYEVTPEQFRYVLGSK